MNGKNSFVLDSFALLSWFQNEAGAEAVDDLIKAAPNGRNELLLCVVNLGEIYYITHRERGEIPAKHSLTIIDNLPIKLVSANRELSLKAAEIKANYPLAYADAFAAALGVITKSAIVTGDPEFKTLEDLVTIKWLKK